MSTISVISNSSMAPITRPQIQDPVGNRVKMAFARALLALIYIILFPVTLVALGCRFYSYLSTKQLIDELAEKRYQAIKAVAEVSLPAQCEVEGLGEAVQELKNFISAGKGHDHLQELRDKIDQVLRLPCYELNKEKRNPHLDFLHLLAHTLTTKAEGMDVLEKYGTFEDSSNPSYEKLATTLDSAVKKHSIFKKDTKLQKAFWIFAHPEKGFNSLFDALGWTDPLSYNSYRQGNANIRIGAFKVNDMKMHFSLGPTLTADRLFEAHLQHLKNHGQFHLQHDLEFSCAHAEGNRRLEKKRIADQSSGTMLYMSTPLDGLIWKGREIFGKIKSTAMFFDELKKHMTGYREMPENPKLDNSFYLPEKLFSEKEINNLLKVTEAMFANSGPNNRAQLLGFEACLAVHAILKSTDGKQGEAYFGQACKQDIDRGVIINIMTILYFDALGGVKLTKERMHQIIGIVLGRPEMVDDRSILTNRYSALSDLLHIISLDPEKFFAPMKEHFKGTDVSFETGN